LTVSLIPFWQPRGLKIAKAEGQYVWDVEGRRYLDFHTGHGVALLGHRNPRIVNALKEQMDKLMVATPAFNTEAMEKCLITLSKILPKHLNTVFFQNSGAEAVELALKIAVRTTKRKKILAFINSFHGRTMGALSVTWNPKYREGYGPFPWEVNFIPYNNGEAVDKALSEEYAAVIVEPVQGEGGLAVASGDFLKALQKRSNETGALLIMDEVQAGFGRTGRVWAHEKADVKPDILVAGKSVAGGFPASYVAARQEIADKLSEGIHGSTHGGNPLAAAAIAAGVETLLSESIPEKAAERGGELHKVLQSIVEENNNVFRGVRGEGLMQGLEMRHSPSQLIKILQQNGLITLKSGLTILRFLPPYLITKEDLSSAREIIEESLVKIKKDR